MHVHLWMCMLVKFVQSSLTSPPACVTRFVDNCGRFACLVHYLLCMVPRGNALVFEFRNGRDLVEIW